MGQSKPSRQSLLVQIDSLCSQIDSESGGTVLKHFCSPSDHSFLLTSLSNSIRSSTEDISDYADRLNLLVNSFSFADRLEDLKFHANRFISDAEAFRSCISSEVTSESIAALEEALRPIRDRETVADCEWCIHGIRFAAEYRRQLEKLAQAVKEVEAVRTELFGKKVPEYRVVWAEGTVKNGVVEDGEAIAEMGEGPALDHLETYRAVRDRMMENEKLKESLGTMGRRKIRA
jgi:hypothetical protein